MDTHYPYEPEPEFDEWGDEEFREIQNDMPSTRAVLSGEGWDKLEALEPLYDGTILQADAVVETLVERLEASGDLDDTLLVVTSDHGEGFGERGPIDPDVRIRYHSWGVHEVLTHVPLVVSYPGRSGEVVDEAVSLATFPDAVRTVARGDNVHDPFARDQPVIASTYRFKDDQIAQYDDVASVNKFRGPWRTVYETHGDTVRKYAQRDDDYATVDIRSAQEVETVDTESHDRTAAVFDDLTRSDLVDQPDNALDDDLEDHLEDLGYIR
jgi:arylsulfatase A-like enzyme